MSNVIFLDKFRPETEETDTEDNQYDDNRYEANISIQNINDDWWYLFHVFDRKNPDADPHEYKLNGIIDGYDTWQDALKEALKIAQLLEWDVCQRIFVAKVDTPDTEIDYYISAKQDSCNNPEGEHYNKLGDQIKAFDVLLHVDDMIIPSAYTTSSKFEMYDWGVLEILDSTTSFLAVKDILSDEVIAVIGSEECNWE